MNRRQKEDFYNILFYLGVGTGAAIIGYFVAGGLGAVIAFFLCLILMNIIFSNMK